MAHRRIVLADFKSKKERKESFKVFFKLIKEFSISKWIWAVSFIFGALIAGLTTFSAWFIGFIIDKFFNGNNFNAANFDFKNYAILIAVLGLGYILQKVLLVVQRFLLSRNSLLIASKIRLCAYKKLQVMPLSYYENEKTGDLMSSMTNDVQNIAQAMTDMIGNCITVTFALLFTIGIMISYSPIIALITLIVIPINFIPIFLIIRSNQKLFIEKQERLGEFDGFLEEIIDALPLINVYQQQEYISKEFDKYNTNLLKPNLKVASRMNLMFPWFHFSKILSLIEIIGVTLVLKQNWPGMPGADRIQMGSILSISMYIYSLTDNFNQMLEIMSSLQMGLGSAIRLDKIVSLVPPVDQDKLADLKDGDGKIEFKNVWFAYPSKPDKFVLKDISFTLEKGKTLALVGHTGCGKTTIAKLLSKLYVPTKGDILINGQSIFDIKESSWRSAIDTILQETYILKGSIKKNLSCVNEEITDEQLIDITKKTTAYDFIEKLENGFDTVLTNNGSMLSDGQKQLLAISRSMVSNRKITILDEATSDMDTISEMKIQKAINALSKEKTLLIIAHRLSTIKKANEILVIEKGEIIERGNHKELLNKKGLYEKLYHAGFDE